MIDQCKYQENSAPELISWLCCLWIVEGVGGRLPSLQSAGGEGDENGGKAGLCWLPPQQREGCSASHGLSSQFQVVYLESAWKRKGYKSAFPTSWHAISGR